MNKKENAPLRKNELDLVTNLQEDTYDSSGEIVNSENLNMAKAVNIQELKQLEKVLHSLIDSGREHIANKYLEGFLEARSVSSLREYLNNLK